MKKKRNTPLQKKLQEILREMRHEAGLRQAELAELLGRPQSFVSKYEAGARILDFLEIRQVCLALGYTMSEFIKRFESDTDEASHKI